MSSSTIPSKSNIANCDINKISSFLAGIHQRGERFELTALRNGASPLAVICTTDTAAEAFANLYNAASDAKGFYVGLNPSQPPERVTPSPNRNSDDTIVRRAHLLIDIDGCKNGTTPEERNALRAAAVELAKRISAEVGWPEPIIVNSGNGAQMWYRIDEPTGSDIVRRCLVALAKRYNGDGLDIDTSVCNASRIGRLPGTWNRKPEYPSDEWRMAEVVSEPVMGLEVVPHEILEELAKDVPAEQAATGFDWGGIKTIPGLELDTEENRKLYRDYLRHRVGGVKGDRGRDNFLKTARFGGDFGLSPEVIWEELTTAEDDNGKTYNDRCNPPWDKDEALEVIRSSFDGRNEPVGCKSITGRDYQSLKLLEESPIPEPAADNTTEAKPEAESESLVERMRRRLHKGDYYLNLKETDLEYWVEDLLPAENFLVDLYGAPGCGKSTLIHQLCICVLNGVDFLGRKTFPVTKRGKVFNPLIVSCEEPENSIARRMKLQRDILCNGEGVLPDVLDLLGEDTTFYLSGAKNGKTTETAEAVSTIIREGKYNFVVIDNRGEVFRADENSREEVTAFCKYLKATCKNLGTQIAVLSHSNKSGRESGSTAWSGSGRVQIKLDTKDNSEEIDIIKTKANDIGRGAWETVKFMPKEGGEPGECLPILITTRAKISEAEQLEMVVNAVKAMEPNGIKRNDLKTQLTKEPFFSDGKDTERAKTATNLINLAEERGLIVQKTIKGYDRLHIVKNEAETA